MVVYMQVTVKAIRSWLQCINCINVLGNVNEAWHDELRALTEALGVTAPQPPAQPRKPETGRPRTQYSETTGRLLPPPSRAMSRGGSRMGQREAALTATMQAMGAQEPNSEDMVCMW